jgi:uncharacterized protein (DUF2147 family)
MRFASLVVLLWLWPARVWAQPSPEGVWHTIDDVTGKPRGIVEIVRRGSTMIGIARGSLDPNEPVGALCTKCTDDRRGLPLQDLEIMRGVTSQGDYWGGGEILDPDKGKTYKVRLKVVDGGRKLEVRGFIGISLVGRTQTWRRAPAATASP